jgi:proteasome alpha subunit
MGGQTEPISAKLRESFHDGMELADAIAVAVRGLQSASPGAAPSAAAGNGGGERVLGVGALEVAVLDRKRPRRAFRRIAGAALDALLPEENRRAKSAARNPGQDAGSGARGAATSDDAT